MAHPPLLAHPRVVSLFTPQRIPPPLTAVIYSSPVESERTSLPSETETNRPSTFSMIKNCSLFFPTQNSCSWRWPECSCAVLHPSNPGLWRRIGTERKISLEKKSHMENYSPVQCSSSLFVLCLYAKIIWQHSLLTVLSIRQLIILGSHWELEVKRNLIQFSGIFICGLKSRLWTPLCLARWRSGSS